jgi:hypothetical protein
MRRRDKKNGENSKNEKRRNVGVFTINTETAESETV